jgi:periplasmic protein TonB
MSTPAVSWHEEMSPREIARWAIAAAIVIGIHDGAVIYLLAVHEPDDVVGSNMDVVTVELAPIDSTPDAVEQDVAPAPETMVESQPLPDLPKPEQQEELKVEQPPDQAPALVPLPDVKQPEKVENSPPPAPVTAQQVKGGAPKVAASWQTSLMRQLQRFKRYPHAAQSRKEEGVVLLSFSLDRSGHVLAHSIARSSGHAELDDEVMAMIMRADPLPPFPESMPQTRVDLTVPIRFSLR